jgi:hypothetical protein
MNVHRNRKVGIHLEAAPNVLRIRVARRANKRSPEGGSPQHQDCRKDFLSCVCHTNSLPFTSDVASADH